MDNIQQNIPRANLKKKNIARLVLYSELSKYYTADQIDQMLVDIATHGTIDLNRYVKKSEVESEISSTSELPVQSKIIYQKLMDYYTKQETYSKEELNNLITTPEQKYVTVTATVETTAITDLLPAIGEANTIYRVGNWDGIHYDDACYTEYAWNGNEYVFLSTKPGSIVDEKYIDNPEYVRIYTDSEDKILWGIKADGDIFFGAGVPTQVVDYINAKISELSLDEYEDIVSFLEGFLGTDTTLQAILESLNITVTSKVDKQEGKSLISSDFAETQQTVENPEYLLVTTDSENKILQGIKFDGTSYIGGDLQVEGDASLNGNIDTPNESIQPVDNPEYLKVTIDAQGKVLNGIKKDGSHYIYNVQSESIDTINKKVADKVSKEEGKGLSTNDYTDADKELVAVHEIVDNPEYIKAEVDSDKKIIEGISIKGVKNINIPVYIYDSFESDSFRNTSVINEEFLSVETDDEGKILCNRKIDGTKVECIGLETPTLKAEDILFSEKSKKDIGEIAEERTKIILSSDLIKKFNLPKYGTANIVSETFYLTSDERYSDKNGIYLIQDYPDTIENAFNLVTLSYFYIKSTLTDNGDGTYSKNENSVRLDFYAATKITKVDNKYYVTSSLTEIYNPETGEITGYDVNENSIKVTQITDIPPVLAWPVDKKTKHNCVVSIDFDYYLSGSFYAQVNFQGSGTLHYRKKNFRFTFFKNNKFEKKSKIKIGELVRTSGFNLKANWNDNTRIKEFIMNRIFMAVWDERDMYDRFPWNKENTPYTGATGMINGFPIEISVGGEFYGLDIFGLKKDKANYLLSNDADGMIEGGSTNEVGCWTNAAPIEWEDELNDEEDWVIDNQTQSNYDALTTFFAFINGRLVVDGNTIPFNKSTMKERMSILDWIDYFICMQVFLMRDNVCRNLMLYTDSDKKKFYPFFYDLDLSWNFDVNDYNLDIMTASYAEDMSLWKNFINAYWDEICNRYYQLRKRIITTEYITALYENIAENIPVNAYKKENIKWQVNTSKDSFLNLIKAMDKRLSWLDKEYFIN